MSTPKINYVLQLPSVCDIIISFIFVFFYLIPSPLISQGIDSIEQNHAVDKSGFPDSLNEIVVFPEQYKITLANIKVNGGKSGKYYLMYLEGNSLYALPYELFYEKYQTGVAEKDLVRIPLNSIRYVSIKSIYTFTSHELERNRYYNNLVGLRFLKNVGIATGSWGAAGLVLDVLIIGGGAGGFVTFPIITVSLAFTGLVYGTVAGLTRYAVDYAGKFGKFKSKHMVERDKFTFKYDFKYGKKSFNKKAMNVLCYDYLNR